MEQRSTLLVFAGVALYHSVWIRARMWSTGVLIVRTRWENSNAGECLVRILYSFSLAD
ncbi:unnamed protein product [Hymenolepis diminuta]|uniref:Secreted protein n=1 Tax=Hymenolepis diminuta TaxID=6216 RepID=A0A0R3SXK2_HYMDI|nr:unnamed protein product [Hymenolepis diminuta]